MSLNKYAIINSRTILHYYCRTIAQLVVQIMRFVDWHNSIFRQIVQICGVRRQRSVFKPNTRNAGGLVCRSAPLALSATSHTGGDMPVKEFLCGLAFPAEAKRFQAGNC